MKHAKLLNKAINSPANLRFGDLVTLLRAAGFKLQRISGVITSLLILVCSSVNGADCYFFLTLISSS